MEVSSLEAPYIDILDTRKLRIYTPTTVKARWRMTGSANEVYGVERNVSQLIAVAMLGEEGV